MELGKMTKAELVDELGRHIIINQNNDRQINKLKQEIETLSEIRSMHHISLSKIRTSVEIMRHSRYDDTIFCGNSDIELTATERADNRFLTRIIDLTS